MDRKIEVIKAYKSQFVEAKRTSADSIIGLLDQVRNLNRIFGRPANMQYAEGFTVTRYIAVNDLFQLI